MVSMYAFDNSQPLTFPSDLLNTQTLRFSMDNSIEMHENIIRRTAKPGNTPTGSCQYFIVLYIFRLESKSHPSCRCAFRGAKLCFSPNKAMLLSKKSYALLRIKLCFITWIQHISLIYKYLRKYDKIRIFPRKKTFSQNFPIKKRSSAAILTFRC